MSEIEITERIAPTAWQQNQGISSITVQSDSNKEVFISKEDQQGAPMAPPPQSVQPVKSTPTKREFPEKLEAWPQPVQMEDVMDRIASTIRKHCVLTDHEVDAMALWVVSSYLIDSFRIFPKLSLISPEKRCGKTTTMEVLMALCKDGLMTANLTPAIIYRLTEACSPTLLIDEADTFVKSGDPALIGMLNSGHSKASAMVMRCDGESFEPRAFSTWMPMVLASIKDLPPTVMDRSIIINLRRKKSTESVDRLPASLFDDCKDLRQQILRWSADHQQAIGQTSVEPPPIGNDRAVDNWVPLFSVAHQISPKWEARCESAYRAVTEISEPELPTELLRDLRALFQNSTGRAIPSRDLVNALLEDPDSTWRSVEGGKSLTPRTLSSLLSPYKIRPKVMRIPGAGTVRGYEVSQFVDAFERYLT